MTDDARAQVEAIVPRGTAERLDRFVHLLIAENERQNLISRTTLEHIWRRHILDSLQLDRLAGSGPWADLGSGAGLPGLVIAIASEREIVLIEPRKRRADFLSHAVDALGLSARVRVLAERAEACRLGPIDTISARAVATLERVFAMAEHLSSRETRWVLPKGRSAATEVATARQTWQGEFRLVQSMTEPESAIVVAEDIRRRGRT